MQEARLVLVAAAAAALVACAGLDAPRGAHSHHAARGASRVPPGWQRYDVHPGDTLGRIAACRGVTVERLARANRLGDPDHLWAGQPLRVPASDRCAGSAQPADGTSQNGLELAALAPAPNAAAAAARAPEKRARELLHAAQAAYDAARFQEALASAEDAAGALAPHGGRGEVDALRARCLLVAGMAAAGLEERDRARAHFAEAFALDPKLSLSREQTSPRILELVDEVAPPGRERAR